jgi:hypothetical protein
VTAAQGAWRVAAGEREALAAALEDLFERITEHPAAEEEHTLPHTPLLPRLLMPRPAPRKAVPRPAELALGQEARPQ